MQNMVKRLMAVEKSLGPNIQTKLITIDRPEFKYLVHISPNFFQYPGSPSIACLHFVQSKECF